MAAKRKEYTAEQKAKMRVAVAKDVIAQVRAKRFVATSGVYVEVNKRARLGATLFTKAELKNPEKSLQEITKTFKSCDVCAKGALFIATVDRFNVTKMKDVLRSYTAEDFQRIDTKTLLGSDPSNYISWLFGVEQLEQIEHAFELWGRNRINNSDNYVSDYTSPKERLLWIMRNIIKNKGSFDMPEYRKTVEILVNERAAAAGYHKVVEILVNKRAAADAESV